MTVIRPNSISGVTSITAQSQSIEFYKSDGNLSGANLDGVNINTAGILTAANFKTGSSNLHSTGLTVGNNFLHTTGINVGTGATIHVPSSNVLTLGTNSNERIRINSNGAIGLGGATYGSSGQVLTSAGSGSIPTWTTISGTTINNNADNRVITGSGSANTLNGEANLTFDGDNLTITGSNHVTQVLKAGGATSDLHIDFKDSSNNLEARIFCASDQGDLRFYTGGANERLRIDSVGRVMIGTTTEGNGNADEFTISYINHAGVSGGDQGRCGMTIRSGDNTSGVTQNGYIYFSDGTSGANESKGVVAYEHSTDSMYLSTNQVARLRIDSNGKIGINLTNPGDYHSSANNLVVHSSPSANDAGITIRSNYAGTGGLYFADGTGTSSDKGYIAYGQSNDTMYFGVNRGSKLQINSSGAFGLAGSNYGSSGQVLTSQGSGSAPQWASAAGNTQSSYVAAPTNNNNYNFSGIPSSAYRVIINYYNISSNSQSYLYSRVGHSGGYQTSGYKYIIGYHYYDVTDSTKTDYSNRAPLFTTNWDSGSYKWAGFQQFDKIYASGSQNAWLINTHTVENTGNGWNRLLFHGRGIVEMGSNTLDRVQLHTSSGNFDSGYIKVDYYT